MNTNLKLSTFYILLCTSIFFAIACSKGSDNPNNGGGGNNPPPTHKIPTVTTDAVQKRSSYEYQCTGKVTADGGAAITKQGICWSTSPTPTIADSVQLSSSAYPSNIAIEFPRLLADTKYYVRAYATNAVGTGYGNEVTFSTPIDIGLIYQGGIVFNYDNATHHGLVAAPFDQGTQIPWAPDNLWTTAVYTFSDDGSINTTDIINAYGNTGVYAAKICRDYTGGGYTDWYLPSGLELNTLKLNQGAIPGFPAAQFLTSFYYWSSTENNYFQAWEYDFNPDYYNIFPEQKNIPLYVRAIRAF